jgi:uncharacterized protein YukE
MDCEQKNAPAPAIFQTDQGISSSAKHWLNESSTFILRHMAQAIMDPEKVRRFADELQRFNSDLENRMSMLHARFAALGDTWGDQEHEKFSEEFKLAMKALKKFVEMSRQHSPYLLRKAQRIEEYLNQR